MKNNISHETNHPFYNSLDRREIEQNEQREKSMDELIDELKKLTSTARVIYNTYGNVCNIKEKLDQSRRVLRKAERLKNK